MPSEDNKILKYYYGKKSLNVLAINYAELERLLEKMHSPQNNIKKSYAEKKTKHTPSGYSLFTNCSFDIIKKLIVTKVEAAWKGF